jgi:SAM-dependent methyltransferase
MLQRLRWPLPAVLVWGLSWAVFGTLSGWGSTPELALGLASALGVAASLLGDSWWRRVIIGLGFPLSLLLTQAASLPAWVWLVPLLALLLIYPLNAWRDAPLFPTPRHALKDLAAQANLASGALILDAGCGLGDGLRALRAAYPQAQLTGIEWSWPLRGLCALRCPWAKVRQGDIWAVDWSGFDMVYLFQRPESMSRAAAKASAELKPGAWLVSLEFESQTLQAESVLRTAQGKPVWVYRAPFQNAKECP